MNESIISLREAGVCYRRSHGFFKGSRSEFWALKSISLDIRQGETLGIVGRNGAGKSTLMRVLAEIIRPDRGSAESRPGLRTTLLSIGVGSHSNLSGRQNAILNGMILGATKQHMQERLESIKEFSELGDFFDEPIYTYSSGMNARLGFATAMEVDPDVMLIDETLSVGDGNFQQKSGDALTQRLKSGRTGVLISHDINTITRLCSRVIWIEDGIVVSEGDPTEVARKYTEGLAKPHSPTTFDDS